MNIGLLTLHLHIPGCHSLKEKRSRLKPLLARLHKEFNLSVAEIDRNDTWQNAIIACALVSNDRNHTQRVLQRVVQWIESNRLDVTIIAQEIELI